MIELPCPHCGNVMFAREERAGQEKVCPACGKKTVVPQVAVAGASNDTLVQVGPSSADMLFGRIALANKLITDVQLAEAVLAQEKVLAGGTATALGTVLQQKGYLTETAVKAVVRAQAEAEILAEDAQYGSIAVANRFITQKMLDKGLAQQKERAAEESGVVPLGRLLQEMG
ncbi:MAG: hypothetical protein HZA54_04915, partial [Planctomycetes bacterium]|nr:hypothetical protein [Planctomycetota bacterium]